MSASTSGRERQILDPGLEDSVEMRYDLSPRQMAPVPDPRQDGASAAGTWRLNSSQTKTSVSVSASLSTRCKHVRQGGGILTGLGCQKCKLCLSQTQPLRTKP